jgi:hypothetical protein
LVSFVSTADPNIHLVYNVLSIEIQTETYIKINAKKDKVQSSSSKATQFKYKNACEMYMQLKNNEISCIEYLRQVGLKLFLAVNKAK